MPSRLLAVVLWLLAWLTPALAEPRTGPDRPFTVDWEVAVPPAAALRAVHFADGRTGWAVGGGGTILLTGDGGESWRPLRALPDAHLYAVAFAADARIGWAVGERGVRLKTTKPNYAPYVAAAHVDQSLGGPVTINVQIVDDEGDPVRLTGIDFRRGQTGRWESIGVVPAEPGADGRWRAEWSPSDQGFGVAPGTTLYHRIYIDDGGPPLEPMLLNAVIVFRPFWHRLWNDHWEGVLVAVGVAAMAALYLVPLGLMLWLAPARLALAGRGLTEAVDDAAGAGGAAGRVIRAVLRLATVPWFKQRPRVRRAWVAAYGEDATRFERLAKDVREDFLDRADVLDAWVAKRLPAAHAALEQPELYRARRTYIPIPIRIGDAATGEIIDQPGPASFRPLFRRPRAVVPIVGMGGGGKSTLACALARWALAEDEELRLAPWPMIPVLVAEDTTDLVASITGVLRRMVGESEVEPDIVRALLAHKRVLVIVDALSERSPETQRHVEGLYGTGIAINALVVTTRREPEFGALERTCVYPQQIDLRLLVPFIIEYLRRRELTAAFDQHQQLELAQRVLSIVEAGGGLTVTPLLVTLFVEAALARAGGPGALATLPGNVPEVFLDYLQRLNPTDPAVPNRVEHALLRRAAFVLAQASLGDSFVPTDFQREEAERRLEAAGLASSGSLVDRLVANGVIEEKEVAGIGVLQFQLDPVAEYLAAIAACHELGGDAAAWREAIATLTAASGYPDRIRGFLTALSVCHASYRVPLRLATVEFPWERADGTDAV